MQSSGEPAIAVRGVERERQVAYERQEREGKEPSFNPDELKISNADFWKS